MSKKIITRFPPSPTGYLHVGGARTALFNWLYARKNQGEFILRIEDTDFQRSTEESVEAIFDGLNWLGIDWDKGPFYQSKRFDIYNDYLEKLIKEEKAYYCDCSPEEVEAMREKAKAEGRKPMYDGSCRHKKLPPGEGSVVRLLTPDTGSIIIDDAVKGSIKIANTEIDDFILRRSDGVFTYNFAVVIDDLDMEVSHVIRGDDHVSNTPKQILIYRALGITPPVFGHVPMVLGPDRTRLSKRHGAMSVMEYKKMGFLPEALLNYLVRLGWSHGDQEFFSREDMKKLFGLESVGKSPGIFDLEKLLALNAEHIQKSSAEYLKPILAEHLQELDIPFESSEDKLTDIVELLKNRSKTMLEMAEEARYFFTAPETYCEKASKKNLKKDSLEVLKKLREKLEKTDKLQEDEAERILKEVCEEMDIKLGKVGGPLRVALTGKGSSPGMSEILPLIGKESSIARLDKAILYLEEDKE